MSHPDGFRFERDGRVAVLTIDRPEAMNTFTRAMWTTMSDAFAEFNADPDLWCAILTGAGERTFCAGGDMTDLVPLVLAGRFTAELGDPTKRFLSDVTKPVIAAVNGACVAGGLEWLLGTDLRVAADHAVFGLGEVRFGLVPAGGGHVRLPRQIPWAVAMEMLLTGQTITAQRAYDVGLVNRVVPGADLMDEAHRLADVICANGPQAVRTAKEIAVRSLNLGDAFTLEASLARSVYDTADCQEGFQAFVERRRPQFQGK